MGFLEGILAWIAEKILAYLLGRAITEVNNKALEVKRDKARGETNAANVKAYEDAKDREARRRAAADLLNRSHG
jgi:hypothetical protein